MIVCGHGDVHEFCAAQDMVVCETWDGNITDYSGDIKTIVTAQEMSVQEFFYLRMIMLSKGYDVRSIHYPVLEKELNKFVEYVGMQERDRRKQIYGGRSKFGYHRVAGEIREIPEMIAVARKVIELRDAGVTLRGIQSCPEVHHPDGRKISISTIQQIIRNRDEYFKKV